MAHEPSIATSEGQEIRKVRLNLHPLSLVVCMVHNNMKQEASESISDKTKLISEKSLTIIKPHREQQ